MALSSMTGFARSHGASGSYAWSWELKSVNAKGLELRLRLPSGFDAVEVAVRAKAAEMLSRGNVYANADGQSQGVAPVVRINEPVLIPCSSMRLAISKAVSMPSKPRLDGLLGLKGVIEVDDEEESDEAKSAAEATIVAGFVAGAQAG